MKNYLRLLVFLLLTSLLHSCIGLNDLKYVQPDENLVLNQHGLIQENYEQYRLKVDDIVSVTIETSDPDAVKIFGSIASLNNQASSSGSSSTQSNTNYMSQRVDLDGNINVYGLGILAVQGLTIEQVRNKVQQKVDNIYVPGRAIARVRFDAINYTILGEVTSPGPKQIDRYRVNLLEAIAYSGDLTKLANRTEIQIIRQYPEGKKRVTLDITKENVMNSPYFYIQPNDIIIVNPRPEKVTGVGGGMTLGDVTQVLGITLQVITTYLFFKTLNN